MSCDVVETLKPHRTHQQQAACGKYIPMYKRLLYSQHVHTVLKKHNLEKGETVLMEGLRALTHSGLALSQPSPILRRCEKHPQAHAVTATLYIYIVQL